MILRFIQILSSTKGIPFLVFLTLNFQYSLAQNNFVPNGSFEEIINCDIQFGEVFKTPPWENIDITAVTTPDLFHDCCTNNFYGIPSGGCNVVYPNTGKGMVAMVNLYAEEGLRIRLTADLPQGQDIYVSCAVIPREKCSTPMETLCYSNTPCLVFSDFQFQNQVVTLETDTIINRTDAWTNLQNCYQSNGTEKWVLLGNFKSAVEEKRDCDFISEQNFSYYFIDDIIVSPFDVVPDTLVLCGNESIYWDATFYEVPISWSDGNEGPIKTIDEPGLYTVFGALENCMMTDNVVVIRIPDEDQYFDLSICQGAQLTLTTPVTALWPNGQRSKNYTISSPGNFIAELESDCGEQRSIFNIEELPCNIEYYVPNAFSPNGDGTNDQMEFFFSSAFEFIGELLIYDRWGNLLKTFDAVNQNNLPKWNGTFKGKQLNPAVFVWVFKYTSIKDNVERFETGDFVLMR